MTEKAACFSYRSALFDYMIQGVLRLGADGNVTDVNSATLKMTGLTLDEFMKRMQKGESAAKPESSGGGTEAILLAEDEPAVLSLTRRMLERLGYTVIGASSPNEAIRLAQKYAGEIHLLLVDVIMPEMTGRELSEQLTRLRPGIK
jgi:PleD family two-component response regulator